GEINVEAAGQSIEDYIRDAYILAKGQEEGGVPSIRKSLIMYTQIIPDMLVLIISRDTPLRMYLKTQPSRQHLVWLCGTLVKLTKKVLL
ncbi:MAG: hypothetical protein PHG58_05740, partial [Clostridia bacterium]|nr:hypothetical protein [Clostridia bacterium]